MPECFDQDETDQLIAELIRKVYKEKRKKELVSHEEIVRAFVNDPMGMDYVKAACQNRHSPEWWGGVMVAAFGAQYRLDDQFERSNSKPYAYRPKAKMKLPNGSMRAKVKQYSPSPEENVILPRSKLEEEFHRAMRHRYAVEVYAATRYRPIRMIEMIDTHGALETIRRLKQTYLEHASEGYEKRSKPDRLDLSFEALMLDLRFKSLFSDEERGWARKRLADYGYNPPNELDRPTPKSSKRSFPKKVKR